MISFIVGKWLRSRRTSWSPFPARQCEVYHGEVALQAASAVE